MPLEQYLYTVFIYDILTKIHTYNHVLYNNTISGNRLVFNMGADGIHIAKRALNEIPREPAICNISNC